MSSTPHEKTESSFAGNQVPSPQDDGFEFIDSPDSRPQPVEQDPPIWFVSPHGSKRSGPFTRSAILERLSAGEFSPETLVWRAGMSNFVPVRTVFPDSAPPTTTAKRLDAALRLSGVLGQSAVLRLVGRSCAVLGLVIFTGSLLLSFWGNTWFEGSILLTIAWLIAEAAAGVVDGLDRIETRLLERDTPATTDRGNDEHRSD